MADQKWAVETQGAFECKYEVLLSNSNMKKDNWYL